MLCYKLCMEITDIDVVNVLRISLHVEINMYCSFLPLLSVFPNIYSRDEEQNGPLLILFNNKKLSSQIGIQSENSPFCLK